jgi:hypothetical protein
MKGVRDMGDTNVLFSAERNVFDALTSYRLVPAMMAIVSEEVPLQVRKCALKAVSDNFCVNEDKLEKELMLVKNWIAYTYFDMLQYHLFAYEKYVNKNALQELKNKLYPLRMLEEAQTTKWKLDAFNYQMTDGMHVMSIGGGILCHFEQLHTVNKMSRFTVIDKRKYECMEYRLQEVISLMNATHMVNITYLQKIVTNLSMPKNIPCDGLFLSQVLHCIPNWQSWLHKAITEIPGVMKIKVLELRPQEDIASCLSTCFDLHMLLHASAGEITRADMENFVSTYCRSWRLEIENASANHLMYTLRR